MLESVLADVLTRVLGQYLEGIDRDSVRFGAWSGLVELRGVALRPEALAVLFETLGMDLPVTVEAGFIGLLRLQVPWNAIGTTPVQVLMEDITIMARPVRGDGSDDSELRTRERRITRARLNTDDAVREASWGVSDEGTTGSRWASWLVSDQLRAKIIDNIQITLRGILLRFEDPFSDPRRPYISSIVCESLKVISTDENWQKAFVERTAEAAHTVTRKLLEVSGFGIDWAPITPKDTPGVSRGTGPSGSSTKFDTPERLKQFIRGGGSSEGASRCLLHPVDGSLRLKFLASSRPASSTSEIPGEPPLDFDVRFPDVVIDLDDVQYACLLQTSVYFAKLATRGFRPKTPKERWVWAVDQLLPGFSERRRRLLQFTEEGTCEALERSFQYYVRRKSLLKARRMSVEEPRDIANELERIEDELSYEEVISLRDYVDRRIEKDGEHWSPVRSRTSPTTGDPERSGTTVGTFWSMLGYRDEKSEEGRSFAEENTGTSTGISDSALKNENTLQAGLRPEHSSQGVGDPVALRVAFLLQAASIRLSQSGYPNSSIPRVNLELKGLQVGIKYTTDGSLIVEALLKNIEAWDLQHKTKMVYSRVACVPDASQTGVLLQSDEFAYPQNVSEAIEAIRSGSNPAKELLCEDETCSTGDDDLLGDHLIDGEDSEQSLHAHDNYRNERKESRHRARGSSESRDSTPSSSFRVAESEFWGNPHEEHRDETYVAAFRYSHINPSGVGSKTPSSKLDVSVATLEAIVDGPKGSFIWGFKFWRPKGMAQDPIMAFLGAAAGARIAELRMELEKALIANKVPMQINAVILAPRFIFPSSSESAPAVVVNMGTLGVCTSESSPVVDPSYVDQSSRNVHYSSYVLTLDDLGVYFSPNLSTAISQRPENRFGGPAVENPASLDFGAQYHSDTAGIERIVRPFSLRFILQTLRDSTVVQVAHASTEHKPSNFDGGNIAKVRVRGNIPGLNFILTQAALQHIVVEGRRWGKGLRPRIQRGGGSYSGHPSGEGWQPVAKDDEDLINAYTESNNLASHFQEARIAPRIDEDGPPPTALASYDVKVLVQKVSVELRTTREARLVTATASKMQASVVKMGRKTLQASFKLQHWSVMDASRGRTAAFRSLVHTGTPTGSEEFSPPRGVSATTESVDQPASMRKDFVNVQYTLDLVSNKHKFAVRFLSLNVICVRETYIRLASFLYKVYSAARNAASQTDHSSSPLPVQRHSGDFSSKLSDADLATNDAAAIGKGTGGSRIEVISQFDGFSFQLVASGGAIAFVEVRNSKIQLLRDQNANMKAWGDFQYFSVKDLTAPISDHGDVLTYEKLPSSAATASYLNESINSNESLARDEWVLSIPKAADEQYELKASFRGITACLLTRFSYVLQQYFHALMQGMSPVIQVVLEQGAGNQNPYSLPETRRKPSAVMINLQLSALTVRVPRHSGCSSEAITVKTSRIHLKNVLGNEDQMQWITKFEGVEYAVDFIPNTSWDGEEPAPSSSAFMNDFEAEMTIQKKYIKNIDLATGAVPEVLPYALSVQFQIPENVLIELCEAQYTVLYFIATENMAETINGSELSIDLNDLDEQEAFIGQMKEGDLSRSQVSNLDADSSNDRVEEQQLCVPSKKQRRAVVDIDVIMPYLSIELSRGWDVTDKSCKVLGVYFGNVELGFTYSSPYHLFFELTGKLLSVSDLTRERSSKPEIFVVPVHPLSSMRCASTGDTAVEQMGASENITLSYEKENKDRPTIIVCLKELQVEVVPELFVDLSCLAVPGWPYLESSALAPDIAYIGRTMTVLLSNSQVLLGTYEDESDRRAIAFTGEFQLKVDWMRGTGAKTVSLQSNQVEVSTLPSFPHPIRSDVNGPIEVFCTPQLQKSIIPLVYPTNCFIEYVAADVDDGGCRLTMSADSVLCLINVGEVPLLKSLISRPSRIKSTYLQRRQWAQSPSFLMGKGDISKDAKREGIRKARENMSLSVTIPAARYLVTDEANGRFIPVLEGRFKSFDFNAHVGSMVQVHGELAVDLFNAKKGWWEPAVESWPLSASLSHGTSGTRAIVMKSEQRLNVNVTPTTVSTFVAIVKSLKSAAKRRRAGDSGSLKTTADNDGRGISRSERSEMMLPNRRPSVAAFLMRNELGIPVYMSSIGSPRQTLVVNNAEVEAGIHSEDLVSSTATGERGRRDQALTCRLRIPSFLPLDLSATEIGKHVVTFFPSRSSSSSQENPVKEEPYRPMRVLWEVEMANGIPVCTLRSLFRFLNKTETSVELDIGRLDDATGESGSGQSEVVAAGKSLALPINCEHRMIRIRPYFEHEYGTGGKQMKLPNTQSRALFDWSPSLPSLSWLTKNAREEPNGYLSFTESHISATRRGRNAAIRCRSTQGGSTDFCFAITSQCLEPWHSQGRESCQWVDIVGRAPIVFCNNLPRTLSYRVVQRDPSAEVRPEAEQQVKGIVIAAGTIQPLKQTHLHLSEQKWKTTFLSLAYDNCTGLHAETHSLGHSQGTEESTPARFGPEVSFEEISSRKAQIVLPSGEISVNGKGQPRQEFRAVVSSKPASNLKFHISAGFWIRNRSDTSLVICSRNSFYGTGSQPLHLRACPPQQLPDDFVCLEGPYLSVSVPRTEKSGEDLLDQSGWWTSPSILEDIEKPIAVGLRGLSLEIEVNPCELSTDTSIVTIRNHSWICNCSSSTLQWCQTSALDSSGNCVTKLVKTLSPGEFHGIHWERKTSYEAVHLRIAEGNGHSDWIWSPAIPLNIGHSRELPAKMYRPKTHEQYIARVASKEMAGGSTALVIYGEDRQNPPYRIVNLCRYRAIAFSQVGSREFPWLVRAGKTTRYSWDNPLAAPGERLLKIRILEPDELLPKQRDDQLASSSQSVPSHRHDKCDLNIDVVCDRALVLSASYDPAVVISISVDRATKIVTFCEEDKNGHLLLRNSTTQLSREESVDTPVPVLGWDDIGNSSSVGGPKISGFDKETSVTSAKVSDYPTKPDIVEARNPTKKHSRTINTDAAVFLNSIGISVITTEPCELMYISWKDVHLNYESIGNLESLALHVSSVQIDNQLERTPYPVLMWTSTLENSGNHGVNGNETALPKALALEIHRTVTDEDILMIKSCQAAIRPFSVCFEDEFVSKALGFLSDTAIMGRKQTSNFLKAPDGDYHEFEKLSRGTSKNEFTGSRGSRLQGVPASKRIYVHSFKVHKTALRLTSSGSGSAVAKAAGINSSAKALVALVLNVENCEFLFPLLHVENIFDSLHHFAILVKEYYVSQARNQRMKLLASNSLVGNPAALFDAVGTGARDFFVEPGRAKGGADFIASVGRGSKSLFANTVGGLVQSVGSIPRAVSSGLEKAVGDNDYLAERERIRGSNVPGSHRGSSAKNSAQGLATGAISFAHGISSGVTGFIKEPVQGARQGGAGGLLKGIGRAFIGGVAKPVAGAIDLVAEPAVGLSRQIADAEQSSYAGNDRFIVPERPPRAFRGRNQRLDSFDMRYSLGVCLYKAVQFVSGVSYDGELLDWVELSGRNGRRDAGSEVWVWNIMQRYSRAMPGSKRQVRSEKTPSSSRAEYGIRPEKVRVALVTMTAVVVATLDCKLVTSIPLWKDCLYDIYGKGKEVYMRVTLRSGSNSGGKGEVSSLLSGAHSLISAPWDAPTVGQRVKPKIGEWLREEIPCGSAEARDELITTLKDVMTKMEVGERWNKRQDGDDGGIQESSSVELRAVPKWQDGSDSMELKETGREERRESGILTGWMGGKSKGGNDSGFVGSSSARREGKQRGSEKRTAEALRGLERRVERLKGRGGKRGVVRMVIVNRLEGGRRLELLESWEDEGRWNVEAPMRVESLDAEVAEVEGERIVGGMKFKVVNMFGEGLGGGRAEMVSERDSGESFVVLEFGGEGRIVGWGEGRVQVIVEQENRAGGGLVGVFSVEEGGDVAVEKSGRQQPGRRGPMSDDEMLVNQLVEIGFGFEEAVVALAEAGGDMVKAVDILTR
eukprot:GFKZ01004506.1.p1 GENE.GFKZ01004506.1~~GFKZ01004506.1.p1  ORF type:complete len:3963 (-),score=461.04 GFKZ01004506.1:365-12253(-)